MKCVKHLIDSEYESSNAASQEELASFYDNINPNYIRYTHLSNHK